MTDSIVHMGENSPEQVAFKLLQSVAFCEGKSIHAGTSSPKAELDPVVWTTGSGFLVGAVPFLSHELF